MNVYQRWALPNSKMKMLFKWRYLKDGPKRKKAGFVPFSLLWTVSRRPEKFSKIGGFFGFSLP